MIINLSQKERMLLEDDKNQEQVCVSKYSNYANQASDSELKQLFNKLSGEEQHHLNMINQLLQGQQPDMSHSQMSQQQGSQSSSQSSQSGTSGMQTSGTSNANDKMLCSDLLSTEKFVSSTYDIGVFESANPVVRQTLQHIQQEEQHHGEQLFNYMHSHGMYPVK